LAMHHYHESEGALPPAAVLGKDGRPLLSWRVLLLPYVEEDKLYREFRLDEPWDSPHNIRLLEPMPIAYEPFRDSPFPRGHTFYPVIVGPGSVFERPGVKFADLKNPSATFLIVEAAEPVPWTKPDELDYPPDGPVPRLGGIMRDGRFRVAMADGRVFHYRTDE